MRKRRPKARFQDGAPDNQHGAQTFGLLLLVSLCHFMEFHKELEDLGLYAKNTSKLKHHELLAATKTLSEFRVILGSGA